MPTNRSIPAIAFSLLIPLAAAGGWAQDPAGGNPAANLAAQGGLPGATTKEEPPTDAEKSVDVAIEKLKKLDTFSADIDQQVSLLGQKFAVQGVFLKGKDYRLYLKLALSGLGDSPATTLQVCDGTTLWDFQQVLDSQTYRKLGIAAIVKKLNDPVLDPPIRSQIIVRLGFSGPDSMLSGLRKSVRFNQKADDTFDGKKVWIIRGEWKDRSALIGPGQAPLPSTMPLPSYIPSNVAVWVGQEDGWPYKIEMVGNAQSLLAGVDSRKLGPDGRPMGPKISAPKVDPSRITLLYKNVKLNPDIPVESFAFQAPPDARGVQDGTEEFLTFLDQAIQDQTRRKKAEESRPSEPATLPGSLDVPKPADPAPPGALPR